MFIFAKKLRQDFRDNFHIYFVYFRKHYSRKWKNYFRENENFRFTQMYFSMRIQTLTLLAAEQQDWLAGLSVWCRVYILTLLAAGQQDWLAGLSVWCIEYILTLLAAEQQDWLARLSVWCRVYNYTASSRTTRLASWTICMV